MHEARRGRLPHPHGEAVVVGEGQGQEQEQLRFQGAGLPPLCPSLVTSLMTDDACVQASEISIQNRLVSKQFLLFLQLQGDGEGAMHST